MTRFLFGEAPLRRESASTTPALFCELRWTVSPPSWPFWRPFLWLGFGVVVISMIVRVIMVMVVIVIVTSMIVILTGMINFVVILNDGLQFLAAHGLLRYLCLGNEEINDLLLKAPDRAIR